MSLESAPRALWVGKAWGLRRVETVDKVEKDGVERRVHYTQYDEPELHRLRPPVPRGKRR